ncbi:MAG: hypothetical protein AAFY72_19220, partial [Cyanobacteria bacterium J06649_4]
MFTSESSEVLKQWIARRTQLSDMLATEKTRRKQTRGSLKQVLQDQLDAHIDWLEEQIEQIDEKITQLSECTAAQKQTKTLLQSVVGIGPL